MPLDIEPLSPRRRAAMLLVLLFLFVGSLGFAQLLVLARKPATPQVLTVIRPPNGLTEPVRALEGLPDAILSGSGQIAGKPRFFVAFSKESDAAWTPDTAQAEALRIFELVLSQPLEGLHTSGNNGVVIGSARLGRMDAIHVQGEFGEGEDRYFLVERMAVVPGRVVAICFSGPGRLTDADKAFFENFCSTRVSIRRVSAQPPATRPE
jgi:hypothetical protein